MADHEYIARISYGKDSLKMLEVIHSRGLPLDRITTTDVWATDTISANLPPMDKFKAMMDERIWSLYHIEVEHLCARNKDGSKKTYEQMFYHVPVRKAIEREREREREFRPGTFLGFPDLWAPWCQAGLKRIPDAQNMRNSHRLPAEHQIQLVPEAQDCVRDRSRDSRSHRESTTARNSNSYQLPFLTSAPRGAKTEISWSILE